MDEILRVVRALQVSDKLKAAIPANWPNNELIGDRVIVPPARTVDEASERLRQYTCYDWWFCHKEGSPEDAEEVRRYLRRVAGT
jgi:peroxiredoxin (alkyl hydroperoxide reductase subunit C)